MTRGVPVPSVDSQYNVMIASYLFRMRFQKRLNPLISKAKSLLPPGFWRPWIPRCGGFRL